MEKVIRYKCEHCGDLFYKEEECIKHEQKHKDIKLANEMLRDGKTLSEINSKFSIWNYLPEKLIDVTKDSCFTIPHWQCCEKPAYKITGIEFGGKLSLFGCGSWNGYYGSSVSINGTNLLDPRPKEEWFVDHRYHN